MTIARVSRIRTRSTQRARSKERIRTIGLCLAAVFTVSGIAAAPASAAPAPNRAMSWGQNLWGRLGNGTSTVHEHETFTTLPAPVCAAGTVGQCPSGPYLNEVSAMSAGGAHSLALLSNGTVMAWGENEYGQLGDGPDTARARAYTSGTNPN